MDDGDKPAKEPSAGDRRPWQEPEISWEEAMDGRPTLMAACGKIGLTGEPCDSSPAS